ncbi:uncharacterized protein LOC127752161, partial [Frankliniella occidentalis]|uniref:Uncharacterized protein LOC127752161 n=1 Tax=Frankliniella occidentalis TaxID=133901 RepID=A0A9C6XBQ2_FRAOC
MASSLPLHHTPAPPRRPTRAVAPLQKHTVLTVQAADARTRTQAPGAPSKPRPEPSRPLFDGLQLIVYSGAALGIVPISFRPLRVGFHPVRSTLPYALLVQAYTWWGAFFEMPWIGRSLAPQVLEGAAIRFWNMHSTLHLAGCLIVLVFWMEAGNIQQLRAVCDSLL